LKTQACRRNFRTKKRLHFQDLNYTQYSYWLLRAYPGRQCCEG